MSVWEKARFERTRQVNEEGWVPEHDDAHEFGELAAAAALYAMPPGARRMTTLCSPHGRKAYPKGWPWAPVYWKPTPGDGKREIIKAMALLAAEHERIERAEKP